MAKRRKSGTGSVHLRKDGRWEGRVVIGYDENGLPKTKNVLTNTKSSCVEKLKELQKSLTPPAPSQPKPKMTVREWLDLWYQTYKKPALRPNKPTVKVMTMIFIQFPLMYRQKKWLCSWQLL